MSSIDVTRFNAMPIARHIGFRFVSAQDGTATVRLEISAELGNAQGIGHGGIVPILADAAGTLAVQSSFERPDDVRILTADLRVNLIGALRIGSVVTATGHVLHVGRSTCFSRVDVVDDAGETVGLGQLTCVARPAASAG